MIERWRCFVAVPLGDELQNALAAAVAGWKADPRTEALRWVEPDALHLTLAFLGELEPDGVSAAEAAIRTVAARHHAVTLATRRLGAFPRPGSVRVVWHGVDDISGGLVALAEDLRRELVVDASEKFRPHITVARARRGWPDLRGWIEHASASAPAGRLVVTEVSLMRSHLARGPARYERLASAPLRDAARLIRGP